MKKVLFFILIFIQILIIVYLIKIIYQRNHNVLGKTSVNPIKKNSLIFSPSDSLKNFYEPKPDTIDKINEWSPYKGIYTINSDSLNERFDYTVDKPEKTYRIITLGDSFTYGLYVDTKDNWTERLEDILNEQLVCQNIKKFEVINLAVQGYDIQYNVERFKKRGIKYNPDLIIWFIVDPLRITEKIIFYSSKINDELYKKGRLEKLNGYFSWINAWKKTVDEFGESQILSFQTANLLEFNQYYQNKLVFLLGDWLSENQKKVFNQFIDKRKNTWQTAISLSTDKRFPNDDHPNKEGHQIIAKEVLDYLLNKKIIPCQQ